MRDNNRCEICADLFLRYTSLIECVLSQSKSSANKLLLIYTKINYEKVLMLKEKTGDFNKFSLLFF